jgi:hypothetical protein
VAGPDGNRPDAGEGAWGWRLNIYGAHEPKGDRVGWLEGDALYLDPDAAYAAAQGLGHEIGDRLAVVPQTLRKRLKERGMLCTLGERRQTLTVRRSFEGQRREVLHLAAATVAPRVMDPDEPEPPGPDGELQAVSWSGFASRWSGAGQVSEGYLTRQNRPSTCGFVVAGQVGQVFRKGERP